MTKKSVDLNELQKLTERGQRRADRREHKKRLLEEQRNEREAKKWSDKVISGLPDEIKKAARRGDNSLQVDLPQNFPMRDKVKRNISSWAWNNGLSFTTNEVRYSDDSGLEQVLVLSWQKRQ